MLGREFRLDALEAVSERSGDELLDLLDEALAARVIGDLPTGRGGLRFSHALIRDSLYGELGRKERVRLHRRAAESARAGVRPRARAAPKRTRPSLPRGGARRRGGQGDRRTPGKPRTALPHCSPTRRPLASTRWLLTRWRLEASTDESARCELLLCLGDAQARGGDTASWKETFAEAADVARKLDAPEQLARAALGYGGRFVWFRAGSDRRLIPLLEDALEALPARESAAGAGFSRDWPARCATSRRPSDARRCAGRRSSSLASSTIRRHWRTRSRAHIRRSRGLATSTRGLRWPLS